MLEHALNSTDILGVRLACDNYAWKWIPNPLSTQVGEYCIFLYHQNVPSSHLSKPYLLYESRNLRKRRFYIQQSLHHCEICIASCTPSSKFSNHSLFFLRYQWSNLQDLHSLPIIEIKGSIGRYGTKVPYICVYIYIHTITDLPWNKTCNGSRAAGTDSKGESCTTSQCYNVCRPIPAAKPRMQIKMVGSTNT